MKMKDTKLIHKDAVQWANLALPAYFTLQKDRMRRALLYCVLWQCGAFISYIKPVWTYGIELWQYATKSNTAVIQRYQTKLLITVTNAPRYVSNLTLHSDLHIPHVRAVFRERTATRHTTLVSHPNPLMEPLVHPPNNRRFNLYPTNVENWASS
jgi:hypothetical protein